MSDEPAFDLRDAEKEVTALKAELERLRQSFRPYLSHLGFCCRGLPSAGRPCNCGMFELLPPISEDQLERRREHADLGPFPDTAQIKSWVNRK